MKVQLSNMNPGDFGVISEVILGVHTGRLMEMGFIRGTRIWVIKNAPLGDPMELSIQGNHVALRRDEAQAIIVDKESGSNWSPFYYLNLANSTLVEELAWE